MQTPKDCGEGESIYKKYLAIKSNANDEYQFKQDLVKGIVKNRIYKKDELNNLFIRLSQKPEYQEVSQEKMKQAWEEVGGVDESLVSGRDDGDLHQKILEHGYTVGRTKDMVLHNEGKLTVKRLFFKKVMYGKDVLSYTKKRPRIGILSYSPIRSGFINNWRLFVQRPLDALVFIVMKTIENTGGIVGILLSLKDRVFY